MNDDGKPVEGGQERGMDLELTRWKPGWEV
jgi:hypothetical protein